VWDDYLHVEQEKTGMKLALPLSLYCDALGLSLGDVIQRCRDRVGSPYLLHHSRPNSRIKIGDPVGVSGISQAFAKAVKLAGIKIKKPPTFHEQRSLTERLYS
jgi:hypothetical protein